MKWLRLYSSVLHDPKVQRLSPALFKHWINLLCLANEGEPRGILPSADDVAFALRIKPSEAASVLTQLRRAGLLDATPDGRDMPHNWPQRQRESDDIAARVRRHRAASGPRVGRDSDDDPRYDDDDDARQSAPRAASRDASGDDVTLQVTLPVRTSNALDTDTDTDTESETETDANASAPRTPDGVAVVASVVPESSPISKTKASKDDKPKREPRYSGEEQAYVRQLVDAYKRLVGVKKLSAEGKERAAAHYLYTAGPDGEPVPVDTVIGIYGTMKSRPFWRGKFLSLQKVAEQYPAFAADPIAFAADGSHTSRPLAAATRGGVTQAPSDPAPQEDAANDEPTPMPIEPEPLRRVCLAGYREDARTWRAVADALRQSMTRAQFDTAFGGARLMVPPHQNAPPDAIPTLVLHSRFALDLMPRYADRITTAFRAAAPQVTALRWVCAAEVVTSVPGEPADEPAPVIPLAARRERAAVAAGDSERPKGA